MTTESRDIVERLRHGADESDEMHEQRFPTELLREAADYIVWLRSLAGAVSQGQSFRDIAENAPRQDPTMQQAEQHMQRNTLIAE